MALMCQRRGCINVADFALKLLVPAVGQDPDKSAYGQALVGVVLCEDHIDEVVPGDFLEAAPDLRSVIAISMGGREPDWDAITSTGVSLNSR